jgi:hypothetical protein
LAGSRRIIRDPWGDEGELKRGGSVGTRAIRAVRKRAAGEDVREADAPVGCKGMLVPLRQRIGRENACRKRGDSWRPPLESGHGTEPDEQPLAAVGTEETGPERNTPGGRRRGVGFWGGGRAGGGTGQPELELVQEGTMDRAPKPVVADRVEALRPHVLQQAADELQRW